MSNLFKKSVKRLCSKGVLKVFFLTNAIKKRTAMAFTRRVHD